MTMDILDTADKVDSLEDMLDIFSMLHRGHFRQANPLDVSA